MIESKPTILIGGGGHASVLLDMLQLLGHKVIAFVSPEQAASSVFRGIKRYSNDEQVLQHATNEVMLVNGIGSLPNHPLRTKIYDFYKLHGFQFRSLVHPQSILAGSVQLREGVQVFAGAILSANVIVSENTIINHGCIVDHDCFIGKHNHIAPGVTLSGGVNTGAEVHIGTGASVIQQIKIGQHCVVGAGAVLTRNTPDDHIVYPARSVITKIKNTVENG